MNAEQIRSGNDGLEGTMDEFQSATQRMENAFQLGKEQLMELEQRAIECSKQAAQTADKYVREKPWQAVGIAAAAGLVIGLLIRRR